MRPGPGCRRDPRVEGTSCTNTMDVGRRPRWLLTASAGPVTVTAPGGPESPLWAVPPPFSAPRGWRALQRETEAKRVPAPATASCPGAAAAVSPLRPRRYRSLLASYADTKRRRFLGELADLEEEVHLARTQARDTLDKFSIQQMVGGARGARGGPGCGVSS